MKIMKIIKVINSLRSILWWWGWWWWWWWWSIGSQAATLDGLFAQLRAKTNGKGGKSGKGKVRLPGRHPTETLKWVNDEKNQDSNVVIRIRNHTWFFSICFLFLNVSVFKTTGGQWPDVYEWQRCRSHAGGIRAGDVAWSFTYFCWYIPGFTLQTPCLLFQFQVLFRGLSRFQFTFRIK